MQAPIDRCPYCGDNEYFYTRAYAQGSVLHRSKYDGGEFHNEDMYEYLRYRGST